MNLLKRILGVYLLTVLTACTPAIQIQQVELPPERSFHRGFSLVPPNEKGWIYLQNNYNMLVLSKYGSTRDETYVIDSNVWGLPVLTSQAEFMDVVKENENKGTDLTRFNVLIYDITIFSGKVDYCARSHSIFEDRAAVKSGGGVHEMILEIVQFTCRHPENANVAVSIGYSHRYFEGRGDPHLLQKATELFENVEFENLE